MTRSAPLGRAPETTVTTTSLALAQFPPNHLNMLTFLLFTAVSADLSVNDVQFLNELPIDKLIRLKTQLQDLVTANYDNYTVTTPVYPNFGAQAMPLKAPLPVKRTDYESGVYKKGGSKLGNLFSMSITTLAFLAFGGYLLCLIVQAVKAKEAMATTTPSPAFFLSAGIKKKPHLSTHLTSYGRRRRQVESARVELPPEQLFDALLRLCEGYARWSQDGPL